MGRVRPSYIKNMARELANRANFTKDFEQNKQLLEELDLFASKQVRNKVAGYIVRVKKNELFSA